MEPRKATRGDHPLKFKIGYAIHIGNKNVMTSLHPTHYRPEKMETVQRDKVGSGWAHNILYSSNSITM